MPESYRFVVTGRVQGVWFRHSTQQQATALGLHGWVLNRSDGAVEGCAHGDPSALETLRQWLHRGPDAARVAAVEWMRCEAVPAPGFEVRR